MLKIKKLIPESVCLSCLGCCRFKEKESIWNPQLLNEEEKDFPKGRKSLLLLPQPIQGNFVCSFLSVCDNKCRVYPRRPFECQLYPFVISLYENKIFLCADLNCPYIKLNKGAKEFKKYTQYLLKLFASRKYKKILKNNPRLAQRYPGVLILGELKF